MLYDVPSDQTSKNSQLFEFSKELVEDWFEKGKGLRSTPLKNYTSGDRKKGEKEKHIGFEGITEQIINKGLELYNLSHRSEVNGKYFDDPDNVFDSQRMDNHIWIDDKVVIIEENRAWIDKPFYILKRGVVKLFLELPHTRKHLSDDVVFIFSSLAKDVTEKTKKSGDLVFGHGERIVESNLSGRPRRSDKYNYFDNGVDLSELRNYVDTLSNVFSRYE
ncbi:hypothetical protein CL614_07590 [archaeon]|nr:hypothetical protein [archaeon]|tara:strand:- start:5234 stop:5890 length:657 start_codon:yes stop_codon:yes gene_type:complete